MTEQEWQAYEYNQRRRSGCKRKAKAALTTVAAAITMAGLLWVRTRERNR
jgi:hypothetical protein